MILACVTALCYFVAMSSTKNLVGFAEYNQRGRHGTKLKIVTCFMDVFKFSQPSFSYCITWLNFNWSTHQVT